MLLFFAFLSAAILLPSNGFPCAVCAPHLSCAAMQCACPQMEVEVGKLVEVPQLGRKRRDAASSLSAVLLASGIIERTTRQWNPKKLQWEARVVPPSVKVVVPTPSESLAGKVVPAHTWLPRASDEGRWCQLTRSSARASVPEEAFRHRGSLWRPSPGVLFSTTSPIIFQGSSDLLRAPPKPLLRGVSGAPRAMAHAEAEVQDNLEAVVDLIGSSGEIVVDVAPRVTADLNNPEREEQMRALTRWWIKRRHGECANCHRARGSPGYRATGGDGRCRWCGGHVCSEDCFREHDAKCEERPPRDGRGGPWRGRSVAGKEPQDILCRMCRHRVEPRPCSQPPLCGHALRSDPSSPPIGGRQCISCWQRISPDGIRRACPICSARPMHHNCVRHHITIRHPGHPVPDGFALMIHACPPTPGPAAPLPWRKPATGGESSCHLLATRLVLTVCWRTSSRQK